MLCLPSDALRPACLCSCVLAFLRQVLRVLCACPARALRVGVDCCVWGAHQLHTVSLLLIPHLSSLTAHRTSHLSPLTSPLPSSFILHPSSFILHPSSLIPHPSSLIPHPSSLIPHPSSLIPHLSSLISHLSSLISHLSSFIPYRLLALSHPSYSSQLLLSPRNLTLQ